MGSPLAAQRSYGPVTTDPSMGEASVSVTPLVVLVRGKSIAEARRGLSVRPGGYRRRRSPDAIDGNGCFGLYLTPELRLQRDEEVRPSLSVSPNGDRAEVVLCMRGYFGCGTLRPDRRDRTVKWEV